MLFVGLSPGGPGGHGPPPRGLHPRIPSTQVLSAPPRIKVGGGMEREQVSSLHGPKSPLFGEADIEKVTLKVRSE